MNETINKALATTIGTLLAIMLSSLGYNVLLLHDLRAAQNSLAERVERIDARTQYLERRDDRDRQHPSTDPRSAPQSISPMGVA